MGYLRNQIIVAVGLILLLRVHADWDNDCPKYCKCKWQSGKRFADCSSALLTTVPNALSSDVQVLDLSDNKITRLSNRVFKDAEMTYLHVLYLKRCGIYEIHKDAFEGLTILIELHLTDNFLHYIHPQTFQHLQKLRNLYLVNNTLEAVEQDMFSNLNYLQNIDLSNNNLSTVSELAFRKDPKLQTIVLKNNKLRRMKPLVLDYPRAEEKLTSLVLFENPWHCDCNLKELRNWTIENNLYTRPTECSDPPYLRGAFWNNISADKFACKPVILEPDYNSQITLTNEHNERTISCKVWGDPIPAISWRLNNKIIEDDPRIRDDKHYIIRENGYDNFRWVNLTIRHPRAQDRGDLVCVARNPGGVDERNISVVLAANLMPGVDSDSNSVLLPLILGVIIGVFVLFIVLLLIFYCLWQRKKLPLKSDQSRSNGGASLDDTEMEKSLITAVNPVTKPPRRSETAQPPSSVSNCGTELSDLNRTLLDNDSVFNAGHGQDDENRAIDETNPNYKLKDPSIDIKRTDRPYPPDLLSFSARASQVSPAGSYASTIPDYARAPVHGMQSPLHSPIYGTLPSNLFRTLPYSRSHSPFTSPVGAPIVQSRQGYVTIPRRPRVPSWSAPSSTLGPEIADPVYDNLGARTTADGGSVVSLNKVVESPMSRRPLPATPSYQQNGLPMYYTPIEEQESPPAPCPRTPSVRGSLQRLPTDDWRQAPDGSTGKLFSREDAASPTPSSVSATVGLSPKVPPKPPPKPKVKAMMSGPLFEDEGEDGTEV